MWIKRVMLGFAALALAGCWEEEADLQGQRIVELEAEISRLSDRLATNDRFITQLKRDGGAIVKTQTLTKSATFREGGDTLQAVKDRRRLFCGGNADLPGFGFLDPDSGEFIGFDIDFCRAVGAAVLGADGADLVKIVPLTSKLRFAALQTGDVDLLSRNTTWTFGRDTGLRVDYVGVTFYDGQGVMVRSQNGFRKLSDLAGKAICVQADSTSERNIRGYFEAVGLPVEVRAFQDRRTALRQYEEEACEAYTGDKSSLMSQRTLLSSPSQHDILLDEISREPLGPVVRHRDDNWADTVRWTLQCMINAEALGVSQENVRDVLNSTTDPALLLLLGANGQPGRNLGLADDFCYQVIAQVGSYRDVYDRHLGVRSDFNLPRGLNAQAADGGLIYPLPFK